MADAELSEEEIERLFIAGLIDAVSNFPSIYDKKDDTYSLRNKKSADFKKVLGMLVQAG